MSVQHPLVILSFSFLRVCAGMTSQALLQFYKVNLFLCILLLFSHELGGECLEISTNTAWDFLLEIPDAYSVLVGLEPMGSLCLSGL